MRRRLVTAAVLLTALSADPAVAAPRKSSSAWAGTLGYQSRLSVGGLRGGFADVAFAPGGRHVYGLASNLPGGAVRVYAFAWNARARTLRRVGCLATDAASGCSALGAVPAAAGRLAFAPDGSNLYVAGAGVATLRLDQTTGLPTPLPAGRSCLGLSAPACGVAGQAVHLAPLAGGRIVVAAAGDRLLSLRRDPGDGALSALPGPLGCTAAQSVPACTPGRGAGWAQAVVAAPDGKHVYAAGAAETTLTLAAFAVGGFDELTPLPVPTDLPLDAVTACPDVSVCPSPALAISPDGRHVVVTAPGRIDDGELPPGPTHFLTRDPATGALTASCDPKSCPPVAPPAAFSADGLQLYAPTYRTVSEAPRAAAFLHTLPFDAASGLPGKQAAYAAPATSGDDDAPLQAIAVSPDGRAVVTSALDVLGRRTAKPPTIRISAPDPRRCVRSPTARVEIHVSGRARGSRLEASAYEEIGFDRSPDLARKTTRRSRLALLVRRRGTDITVSARAIGRDGVPLTAKDAFRFC